MKLKNKDKIAISTHLRTETVGILRAMLKTENEKEELSESPPMSMRRLYACILFKAAQEFKATQDSNPPKVLPRPIKPASNKRSVSPKAAETLNSIRGTKFGSDEFKGLALKMGATPKTAIYWLYLLKKAGLIKKVEKGKYLKT